MTSTSTATSTRTSTSTSTLTSNPPHNTHIDGPVSTSKSQPTDTHDATFQETIYTPLRLLIYDIWVLGIVATFAWGCSVTTYLLPLFLSNIRRNHLDIGVGTGYYLAKTPPSPHRKVTLFDNEPGALETAKTRSGHAAARTVVGDCLKPLPFPTEKFDSVSMYFLLHCLRTSTASEKTAAFTHAANVMTPDGVLTGANILGKGVRRDNFFARFIRTKTLEHGVLSNREDNAWEFETALRECFREVETWVVGSVFIFRAVGPKVAGEKGEKW
ncbi:MAG: hypothetical protein L6R40_002061 [Gallowayella cf. fulva]|nr:MAG: hypothetical protein L6R40_002061 [Xanthomendoza cf. fulva]